MDSRRSLPHIILVRPRESGNVGAAARAMANMGLEDLVIVDPGAPVDGTARAFAVGAAQVLDRHRRVGSLEEALAPYARLVGTTSVRARKDPGSAPLITARELPARLAADPPETPTALVFGPEPSGLTDAELALLSPLVTVPCSPDQPTLNLAQAVLVVTYELFLARLAAGEEVRSEPLPAEPDAAPATASEVAGLLEHVRHTLAAVGFARDDSFEAVMRDLDRLGARARLTQREVRILRGICRRTQRKLETEPD